MRLARLLALAALLFAAPLASFAAITCPITATSPQTIVSYDPFSGSAGTVTGDFSITCNRTKNVDGNFPASFWLGVNDGANNPRTLTSGGNTLAYSLYTDSGTCASALQGTTGYTFANGNTKNSDTTTGPFTGTYCLAVAASLTATVPGTYTGSFVLRAAAAAGGAALGTATINVSVTVPASCTFVTPPTNMNFTYTAFTTNQQTANNPFQVRCTNTTPYTLSLSPTSATLLGLNYTAALVSPTSSGTGAAQNNTVKVTIPSGQAGTCTTASCTGSQTHTLTITY
jgi:spore coat protein U-like protein